MSPLLQKWILTECSPPAEQLVLWTERGISQNRPLGPPCLSLSCPEVHCSPQSSTIILVYVLLSHNWSSTKLLLVPFPFVGKSVHTETSLLTSNCSILSHLHKYLVHCTSPGTCKPARLGKSVMFSDLAILHLPNYHIFRPNLWWWCVYETKLKVHRCHSQDIIQSETDFRFVKCGLSVYLGLSQLWKVDYHSSKYVPRRIWSKPNRGRIERTQSRNLSISNLFASRWRISFVNYALCVATAPQ